MAKVSERFEELSPVCRGWVQCWPDVAEFNHLALVVSDLRAREGGSQVAAAVVGGRASAHAEVDEQLCAAVQQVTGDAGDQEEQADPRTVPADATQWQAYSDPLTGYVWYWNAKTMEALWSDPTVMSLHHTSSVLDAAQPQPQPLLSQPPLQQPTEGLTSHRMSHEGRPCCARQL